MANPIYLSAAGQGSTTVEVEIKSKAFQAGPSSGGSTGNAWRT